MSKHIQETSDTARFEEAQRWHARLESDSADDREWLDFAAWLEADDRNADAYHKIVSIADFVGSHTEGLKAEWEASDSAANTPNMGKVLTWRANIVKRGKGYLAGAVAVAATLVFLAIGLPYFTEPAVQPQIYVSGHDSARLITLPDGSRIYLNVNSRIEVLFEKGKRRTSLLHGEAMFDVAKAPDRPFFVKAGDSRIQVLGTVFNVLRYKGDITVTVSEGVVDVIANETVPPSQKFAQMRLRAGDQFQHEEGTKEATVSSVDAGATLAWRQGRLVYSSAPLRDVVDDLNRYFNVPVLLDDAVLEHSFSGVLRTDDLASILLLLEDSLPVQVEHTGDKILITQQ